MTEPTIITLLVCGTALLGLLIHHAIKSDSGKGALLIILTGLAIGLVAGGMIAGSIHEETAVSHNAAYYGPKRGGFLWNDQKEK